MEDQCSPLSNWSFYYQEEGMEEYLKHSLLYTSLELETTIFSAREEIARKDDEIEHLKALLTQTTKERDESVAQCQGLMVEILLQQQKNHPESAPQRICDDSFGNGICSSDSDENEVNLMERIEPKKPLPEKGKFLRAVMEAGPLLQTLLLAGPLPQWQHPPPHLSSIDIPPVTISSPKPRLLHHQDSCLSTTTTAGGGCFNINNKRVLSNSDLAAFDSSPTSKNQRVVHQSSLTPSSSALLLS